MPFIYLILASLLLLPIPKPALAAKAKKEVRAPMHVLAAEMSALQRYLLSEAQFADPKNSRAIRGSIESMRSHVAGLGNKKGPFAGDPALRANANQLTRHLEGAARAFRGGEKDFSRYMLQSSLGLCIACHTAGKVAWDFQLPEGKETEAAPIERASFLFATRQFEKGKELFEEIVSDYSGKDPAAKADVQKSLNALAVYYVRVKEDPAAGAEYFGKVAKKSWASENEQKQYAAWSQYLKNWSTETASKLEGAEANLAEARKVLAGDDLKALGNGTGEEYVRRLRASALLHRALEAPGAASPAKGEALRLLGQVYQRLNHQLFFRFGEMYLRACVQEYAGEKIAQGCFEDLEHAISEGYTGSGGTKIPADERAELARLKKLAY